MIYVLGSNGFLAKKISNFLESKNIIFRKYSSRSKSNNFDLLKFEHSSLIKKIKENDIVIFPNTISSPETLRSVIRHLEGTQHPVLNITVEDKAGNIGDFDAGALITRDNIAPALTASFTNDGVSVHEGDIEYVADGADLVFTCSCVDENECDVEYNFHFIDTEDLATIHDAEDLEGYVDLLLSSAKEYPNAPVSAAAERISETTDSGFIGICFAVDAVGNVGTAITGLKIDNNGVTITPTSIDGESYYVPNDGHFVGSHDGNYYTGKQPSEGPQVPIGYETDSDAFCRGWLQIQMDSLQFLLELPLRQAQVTHSIWRAIYSQVLMHLTLFTWSVGMSIINLPRTPLGYSIVKKTLT